MKIKLNTVETIIIDDVQYALYVDECNGGDVHLKKIRRRFDKLIKDKFILTGIKTVKKKENENEHRS
tara:strand:+ start:151 stop:351 length:201 start_codon:yes stop_codon:yes gene_type:complete